jgi:hypothetical protein
MREDGAVSAELGLIVLAVIFAVGVAGLAVTMILVLPGALLVESSFEEWRRRRKAPPSTDDGDR